MCVLAFAWRAHPRWHLVAAGNRDELHARPAAPIGRWDDGSGIIAGRDVQSGGSWMGVSEQGRFAVVTNLRGYGPPQPKRVSRGALVSDPLAGRGRFAELRTDELAAFNPFNLIVADGGRADFLTNRPEPLRRRLEPGVYGLSNGPLDAPWPKTLRLKEGLSAWLDEPHAGTEALLALLPTIACQPTQPRLRLRTCLTSRRFHPSSSAIRCTAHAAARSSPWTTRARASSWSANTAATARRTETRASPSAGTSEGRSAILQRRRRMPRNSHRCRAGLWRRHPFEERRCVR